MSGDKSDSNNPADTKLPKSAMDNAEEIMFRQIHPTLYQGGAVASSAFMPTDDDQGMMSVDRSSLTTAKESFDLYRENGRESAAVYGVNVQEFAAEGILCWPDPLVATDTRKANPAHAFADYTGIGTNQRRKKAQRLRTVAVSRGILYTTN